jgi:hypothetical protein
MFRHAPRSLRPPWSVRPWGTADSIAVRTPSRSSGSCEERRLVRTAIMPQPMSTPTAAGMMAPRVATTLPTVAPIPRCTSGITATCRCTNGSRAIRSNWARASTSNGTPTVQDFSGAPPSMWNV